ncbi:immunity protein Imm33 domain-containing protein [Nocardioides sp. LML1-1-1.1]|uniref:immunity protein Imm33 domain-containing protein n=1 Tax=Nocardioides sp. LML1-1-1.1 TaxID=3135248 RepID=UPI00341D276C
MDPGMQALLARGGWELDDPRPVAAAHPETFELPSAADLAALVPGSPVRALFRLATIADAARDARTPYDDQGHPVLVPHVERMWAVVTAVDDDAVECLLDNQPYATHTSLTLFDRLRIPLTHLIATGTPRPDLAEHLAFVARMAEQDERPAAQDTPVDPHAAPRVRGDQQGVCERAGVRAEPAWPFGAALLARDVTPEVAMLHGARFPPNPERRDTGWVFFAGDGDFEEVAATVGFDVVMLQQASQAHPAIWPRSVLPPGWGFSVGDGVDDLYPVEITD